MKVHFAGWNAEPAPTLSRVWGGSVLLLLDTSKELPSCGTPTVPLFYLGHSLQKHYENLQSWLAKRLWRDTKCACLPESTTALQECFQVSQKQPPVPSLKLLRLLLPILVEATIFCPRIWELRPITELSKVYNRLGSWAMRAGTSSKYWPNFSWIGSPAAAVQEN